MKKNKKLKVLIIVLVSIVLIVVTAFAGTRIYIKSKLSKMNTVDIPKDSVSLGIDENLFSTTNTEKSSDKNNEEIKNILLLGIDSRDPKDDVSRSDSMMVLTIDKKHNKLKLTSIMRDSLVNIEGHGQEKITHAHAYGGALLSIKTVNQNYNLNITDYIQVNFFGLEKIIDYIGGVPINVKSNEVFYVNSGVDEVSKIEQVSPTHINSVGLQNLNGRQAVAYSRIRYTGNSDFERTERQRTVLSAILNKLSSRNATEIPRVIDTIMPYVETSLKPDDIMSTTTYILSHGMTNMVQSRVPYDGLYKNATVQGLSVLVWDKEPTIKKLHEFIFGTEAN